MSYHELAERIVDHLDEELCLRQGVAHEAPILIRALQDVGGYGNRSLRDIARRAELSPTYLSQVANGKAIISFDSFVALARLLPEPSPLSPDRRREKAE